MEKLRLNTAFVGREYYFFDKVDSTNAWLLENSSRLSHGCVAVAACQTQGRGRRGRAWQDAPGQGLYCSVLLKRLSSETFSLLPVSASLAVCRSLFSLSGARPQIKWPNDVLFFGKKVCGILCEGVQDGEGLSAVCGIGVNLLQETSYFQERELSHAGSLLTQTGISSKPEELLPLLLEELEKVLHQQETQGFSSLRGEYRSNCVTLGKEVLCIQGDSSRQGKALDIDEEGRLVCRFAKGVEAVASGEVSVRGLYGYVD